MERGAWTTGEIEGDVSGFFTTHHRMQTAVEILNVHLPRLQQERCLPRRRWTGDGGGADELVAGLARTAGGWDCAGHSPPARLLAAHDECRVQGTDVRVGACQLLVPRLAFD